MAWYVSRRKLAAYALTCTVLLACWLVLGHWVRVSAVRDGPLVKARLQFLVPMNRQGVLERLEIGSEEAAHRPVRYDAAWEGRHTLVLVVDEEEYPRGLRYTLRLRRVPALVWPFSVSAVRRFSVPVPLSLVSLSPQENAPTRGPVALQFSTAVDAGTARQNLKCDHPGEFRPVTVKKAGGQAGVDLSLWEFIPRGRMEPERRYHISLGPGLRSAAGSPYKGPASVAFTTAPPFLLLECYPRPGAPSIWLSRRVTLLANQKIREAQIRMEGVDGRTSISGDTVTFTPERCLRPGRSYRVAARLVSEYGEILNTEFSFSTTRLGPVRWLEVRAEEPAVVWIMTGDRQLKRLTGTFTRSPARIPKVTMYEAARGMVRTREGEALSWIRLNADLLLHSLPEGSGKDDHARLGLPRAYACLLLPPGDMEWIMRHFERGFMVLVHD